ncbi:MAG: sigma-70 family RNA polymerase sigma factor, partial [Clostridia bacterium]|nr:sigma-70 family RNA polymerase sigma factor [Clostridia bacterium]
RRFKNKGIEYDDLFQLGSLGFVKALNNFDESFGVRFSTYAVPMIVGEIKRYIRDNGAVKVSRTIKILASKINRFIEDYTSKYAVSPSIECIAQEFLITREEVVMAIDSTKMPISIYDSVDGDEEGLALYEKLSDTKSEDESILEIELHSQIDKLPEREKKIIYLRYFRAQTQSEVAKSMGISQVQVSRLENKIIEKMRKNFELN